MAWGFSYLISMLLGATLLAAGEQPGGMPAAHLQRFLIEQLRLACGHQVTLSECASIGMSIVCVVGHKMSTYVWSR